MNRHNLWLPVIFLCLCGFHWWDPLARWIGIGNDFLKKGDLEKAKQAYLQAKKIDPQSSVLSYNLGSLYLKDKQNDKAIDLLDEAAHAQNPSIQARAYYNKGCGQLQANDLDGAIASFKKALRLNPGDMDAKINLELAQQLKEQAVTPTPPPQEKQSDSYQTPQPTPSSSPSQPLETPSPSAEETPSPAQKPDMPTGSPSPSPSPTAGENMAEMHPQTVTPTPGEKPTYPPAQAGEMSPEEAARLLDAMEEEEQSVLKRFHALPKAQKNVEKDW